MAAFVLRSLAGAFFLYLSSRLKLSAGGPVPVTGHIFCIALLALLYDTKTCVFSVILYLAAGALGLDVFSSKDGLAGSGAGYLLSLPFGAAAMSIAAKKSRKTLFALIASLLPGLFVVYLCGAACLLIKNGPETALLWGIAPFVLWDFIKIAAACLLALGVWASDPEK